MSFAASGHLAGRHLRKRSRHHSARLAASACDSIARVALSLVTFAAIRDRTYVIVAAVVLVMVCLGLAGGSA